MGEIVYLNKAKRFSLEGARSMLGQVREVTERAIEETRPIIEELQTPSLSEKQRFDLSQRLQERVDAWTEEVGRLGAVAKGLWLVDFDSGSGFYCWRHDEEDIEYFHGYEDGFSGRMPIQ